MNVPRYLVAEILQVMLEDEIFEIYFNVANISGERRELSFRVGITYDAETISYSEYDQWVKAGDFAYEIYSVVSVDDPSSSKPVSRLIGAEIDSAWFGFADDKTEGAVSLVYFIDPFMKS
jgi:hypothetical protein